MSEYHSSSSLQNSSKTFSFPKSKRFDFNNSLYNHNVFNNDIPSLKSQRATSFGYGNKMSFISKSTSEDVSVGKYDVLKQINANKQKKKFSFGKRFVTPDQRRLVPGVGSYNVNNDRKFKMIQIQITPRRCLFYEEDIKKSIKGVSPVTYKPRYNYVKNNRYKDVSFGNSERPKVEKMDIDPGPGFYELPTAFGKYKLPIN